MAIHIREHGSSYSVGTLQGVLSDMVDCTRELLKQGYSVDFEGLMRLYVTANSKGVSKVEDFNPSVHFTRINLRVDVEDDVQDFLNNNPVYEYAMTREEQAAAKKAAKAALLAGSTGTDGNGGSSGNSTENDDDNDSGNNESTDSGNNGSTENGGTNSGDDNNGDSGSSSPSDGDSGDGDTGNDDSGGETNGGGEFGS